MFKSVLKLIKVILVLTLCLCAVAFGALFAYENPEKLSPKINGFVLPELSLGYYLIAFSLLGLLLGVLLSFFAGKTAQFKLRRENKKLQKHIKKLEREGPSTIESNQQIVR